MYIGRLDKVPEKALCSMRRNQILAIGPKQACVGFVPAQVVEMGKMSTCTVHKKTEKLFEGLLDRSAFFILFKHCEPWEKYSAYYLGFFKVSGKQTKSGSAGDHLIYRLHPGNFVLFFAFVLARSLHQTLHFFGAILYMAFVLLNPYISKCCPNVEGFLCTKID
jgi:hypothetical protein